MIEDKIHHPFTCFFALKDLPTDFLLSLLLYWASLALRKSHSEENRRRFWWICRRMRIQKLDQLQFVHWDIFFPAIRVV